jgi:hypothetical protein
MAELKQLPICICDEGLMIPSWSFLPLYDIFPQDKSELLGPLVISKRVPLYKHEQHPTNHNIQ